LYKMNVLSVFFMLIISFSNGSQLHVAHLFYHLLLIVISTPRTSRFLTLNTFSLLLLLFISLAYLVEHLQINPLLGIVAHLKVDKLRKLIAL
jgi:hypothetical protein